MQLDFITENILNPDVIIPLIKSEKISYYDYELYKQYNTEYHKVNSPIHRRDKIINVPDPYATEEERERGKTVPQTVYVNRISLALQKLIVSRKTAFTTGGNVNLHSKPENETEQKLYDAVSLVWRNNKLQYKNAELFKTLISETEVAEIWNETAEGKLKVKIYSPANGFELCPVFDANSDLIAFGLGYVDGKKQFFDLYTDERRIRFELVSGGVWNVITDVVNPFEKIPVVYYQVNHSAWHDVENMIDRLEYVLSNFADTIDYNGSPIMLAKGAIEGWSSKGESGKVIQAEGDADIRYITWDSAPEAIKLEIETLFDLVFTTTQTPNISFKEMKGLGDISGVAFDRIMIDAHLSAKDFHNGVYGEGIQRRLNFLKKACAVVGSGLDSALDMEISPVFSLFNIDNEKERIELALLANGGKPIMTLEESIAYAGFSDDAETTAKTIKEELLTNTNI